VQGPAISLGREIASITVADRPEGLALAAFVQGPPILLHANGEHQEIPGDDGVRTFAVLDRSGSLLLHGSSKGLLCLLDRRSLCVLDALQVC
jgi:hypothetical protein